jgi:hypothetical protein
MDSLVVLQNELGRIERGIGGPVTRLSIAEDIVLGQNRRHLSIGVQAGEAHTRLGERKDADAKESAQWRAWADEVAAARGLELERYAFYEMPKRVPGTPKGPLLAVLKHKLGFALEHMPEAHPFVQVEGWIIDKGTNDPREPNSEAWITCRAAFEGAGKREHYYASFYVRSWPESYDREVAQQVLDFAAWAAETYGTQTEFLVEDRSR